MHRFSISILGNWGGHTVCVNFQVQKNPENKFNMDPDQCYVFDNLIALVIISGQYIQVLNQFSLLCSYSDTRNFSGMFAAPLEEFVFRGFLWGYLLKTGISMKKAMWI